MSSEPRVRASVDRAVVEGWESGGFAAWIVDQLAGIGRVDGLYCATGTAGAHEADAFWASACQRGPRLASPKGFPWTLASSPAAHVASALQIRGPVVTLVGEASAGAAAVEHALADLAAGHVERALVVAFDRWRSHAEVTAWTFGSQQALTMGGLGDQPGPASVGVLTALGS